MPVTKTAKRALRSSKRKEANNKKISAQFDIALRIAKSTKSAEKKNKAISLAARSAKKNIIHKNKAARIISTLSKLLPKKSVVKTKPKTQKKTKSPKPSKK